MKDKGRQEAVHEKLLEGRDIRQVKMEAEDIVYLTTANQSNEPTFVCSTSKNILTFFTDNKNFSFNA